MNMMAKALDLMHGPYVTWKQTQLPAHVLKGTTNKKDSSSLWKIKVSTMQSESTTSRSSERLNTFSVPLGVYTCTYDRHTPSASQWNKTSAIFVLPPDWTATTSLTWQRSPPWHLASTDMYTSADVPSSFCKIAWLSLLALRRVVKKAVQLGTILSWQSLVACMWTISFMIVASHCSELVLLIALPCLLASLCFRSFGRWLRVKSKLSKYIYIYNSNCYLSIWRVLFQ